MDRKKAATLVVVIVTVLVGTASYVLRAKQSHGDAPNVDFSRLPYEIDGYTGTEERFAEATYTVLGADTTTLRRYMHLTQAPVWLFVAYFGEQNYGQQIHSPRQCLPGGGWQINLLEQVPVEMPGRGSVTVNRMLIESNGRNQVMYYFFATRTGFVAEEFNLKISLARAALSFRPRDAAFIRVTVGIENNDVAAADREAVNFMVLAIPPLLGGLPFE